MIAARACAEFFERHARIRYQRQRGVLEGIHFRDVDVDESDVGILKSGLRCRREIAIASSDADHQVRFARHSLPQ